ncbi:phospho-sugar mutase [Brevibacterium sp. 5221]|uniref:Phospho-sugar mutase n=1 Tax=Brevibacterium rongguiense TaxID=2695267 RepID=A0A6N9H464_9MICO|nr:phospho-sugar mutase [Brevibacterium rongguiense]MYM18713.1 phospho-sugar mutase [Brevibacterium rongguiense]
MAVADRFTAGFDPQVVAAWIADDPDPATRAELQALLATARGDADEAAAARADLEDRFAGPLAFGTAGLRGALGGGPNRMNRAVVIRAAAGLAAFLRDTVGEGFSVVIGCDARYGSADFAADTAAVVTAAGGRAIMLPPQLPTPLLAFALLSLRADAGVMVTASHNPPRDNGYKVYLGESALRAGYALAGEDPVAAQRAAQAGAGAQIVPPFDAMIAERIAAVDAVASVPRAQGWETLGDEVVRAYLDRLRELDASAQAPLRIVLTAMHGVGGQMMTAALHEAGFEDVVPVDEQFSPDPDFPTVAFPNPEEPGALDLAIARAQGSGAELIIANDPDADRFSAAIPDPQAGSGTWRQLTGDEVGLLLGEFVGQRFSASEATHLTMANSIVSSRALAAVAAAHGLQHVSTLTGFKWISRVPGLVFGYEEALGYCVDPAAVRDKDGISAGLLFAALASRLKAEGRTVDDELARIRARDGVRLTAPLSFRVADVSLIAAAMRRLREAPPAQLAGSPVERVVDLSEGSPELPPTDGMVLETAAGDRVIIRPSGTEPKLKCYLEAAEPVAGAEALAGARSRAAARLAAMREQLAGSLGL